MVLVKTRFKSSPAWDHHAKGGAAQAVWIEGTLVVSCYLAPVAESSEVADEVAAVISSVSHQKWLVGGDFNCLPNENPLPAQLNGEVLRPNVSTRWASERCIH